MTVLPLASAYREAVKVAIILQMITTLLLISLLDGGMMARMGAAAMVGFWTGVAVMMLRRPRNPSSFDLLYVRWGYIAMLMVGIACMPFMGALSGVKAMRFGEVRIPAPTTEVARGEAMATF